MRVVVTDAEFPDLDLEREVIEGAGFELVRASCRTPEEVIEAAQGATALIVQYAPLTAEVFDALSDLRIVSRYGVGVDTVDLDAASRHGVWVANVPDYGTAEVAAHTVALLMSVVRHLPFHDRAVRDGVWDFSASGVIHRLDLMTLGLLGLGRIGRMVAERAGPWFGRVVANDPYLPDDDWPEGVDRLEHHEAVAASHVLSLHLPLTAETAGSIDRSVFAAAPDRGLYLVNTARGGLVNLDDLVVALDDGTVRAAALDVLPDEPPPLGHPILQHPSALITPHAAWYSQEAARDLRRMTAQNVVDWQRTGRPPSPVNAPSLEASPATDPARRR